MKSKRYEFIFCQGKRDRDIFLKYSATKRTALCCLHHATLGEREFQGEVTTHKYVQRLQDLDRERCGLGQEAKEEGDEVG